MRVLVTGATGFLGSHITEQLLRAGDVVTATRREESDLRWIPLEEVQLVEYSAGESSNLRYVLPDIDAVIHCAAITRARRRNEFYRVNARGTLDLLELCADYAPDLKRFVFISSQAASCPACEGNPVRETSPEEPISAYGTSKLIAERTVREFSRVFPTTIIRPPSVYGPRDRDIFQFFKLVKRGVMPSLGDPERRFSAIYVKDLARAISMALRADNSGGRTYFVTDGKPHSWREFGAAIAEALDVNPLNLKVPEFAAKSAAALAEAASILTRKAPLLSLDKVREISDNWVCSDELIRRELGYSAEYDLESGIRETAEWYKKEGWL